MIQGQGIKFGEDWFSKGGRGLPSQVSMLRDNFGKRGNRRQGTDRVPRDTKGLIRMPNQKGRTFRLNKIQEINLNFCSFSDAQFILEAKILPNYWVPVHKFYPEILNLVSHYRTRDDASFVKAELKKLLKEHRSLRRKKRPIRVRHLEHPEMEKDQEDLSSAAIP